MKMVSLNRMFWKTEKGIDYWLCTPTKPKYGNYRLRGKNKRFWKSLKKQNNHVI